jgi:hypothetical protein
MEDFHQAGICTIDILQLEQQKNRRSELLLKEILAH